MEYLQSFDPTLAVDLLDSSPEEGTGAAEQPFISRVKGMPNEHFLSCLFMTYEHLLLALGRASCVHEFLLQNMPSGSGDKGDEAQQQAEAVRALSKSCVTTALDLSQRSVAQLLNLRKDSITKLPVEKMKFLWETSLHFCAEVEKLAGEERGCAYTVRQALVAQTTNFLAALHDQYKLALTSTLDCEKWVQCDVGVERQTKIDKLCGGGFVLGGGTSAPSAAAAAAAAVSASSSSSSSSSKQKNPAIVDGKQFKVTWSALLLTEQVVSYLDMAVSFSPAVGEIIANCCSLFKLFNLTTLKLILGSGAQKSQAQLKSISAKHLAITSQSIGLVYALLPHLRAAFLALLQHPGRQQVQLLELDRVTHELLDHHGQILAKFVVILGDSVEGSREKLNNFDFDRVAAGAKCDYFEDVARNVATLHRVLLDALPPGEVNDVFSRIFQLLGRKCLAHFEQGEVMPLTATGRARILDEVHWLGAGFAQLKGGVVGGEEGIASIERGFRKRYGEQVEGDGADTGSAKE
jgi:vacuolar protein sorting-associated protein 54